MSCLLIIDRVQNSWWIIQLLIKFLSKFIFSTNLLDNCSLLVNKSPDYVSSSCCCPSQWSRGFGMRIRFLDSSDLLLCWCVSCVHFKWTGLATLSVFLSYLSLVIISLACNHRYTLNHHCHFSKSPVTSCSVLMDQNHITSLDLSVLNSLWTATVKFSQAHKVLVFQAFPKMFQEFTGV